MIHGYLKTSGAGFSVLEMLIALSVLAIFTSIAATGFRPTSPKLELRELTSSVARRLATTRMDAVDGGKAINLTITDCNGISREFLFLPNGTVVGGTLCLGTSEVAQNFRILSLTASLEFIDD